VGVALRHPTLYGVGDGYNATTLAQKTVINVTPNGNEGAIWGAGAGLTADDAGDIFFLDANGSLTRV